jgi:hypothetical protein
MLIMATIKKNSSVSAFSRWLSKNYRTEWEMAFNTNPERGKVYDQHEFLEMFDRYGENTDGCSKAVHLLKHIVVKRHQKYGYIPEIRNEYGTGNQLIDEINCYKRFNEKEEADLLCPVLKYFTSKSDKVSATSETMQHNVLIIAQKAVYVSDAWECCKKAERLNAENGFRGEDRYSRLEKMEAMSKSQNWRDAMRNPGNSGVIFDYSKGCYKAVFIDYAL